MGVLLEHARYGVTVIILHVESSTYPFCWNKFRNVVHALAPVSGIAAPNVMVYPLPDPATVTVDPNGLVIVELPPGKYGASAVFVTVE